MKEEVGATPRSEMMIKKKKKKKKTKKTKKKKKPSKKKGEKVVVEKKQYFLGEKEKEDEHTPPTKEIEGKTPTDAKKKKGSKAATTPNVKTAAVALTSTGEKKKSFRKDVLAALIEKRGGLNQYITHSQDKTGIQMELLQVFNTETGLNEDYEWLKSQLRENARKVALSVQ